MSKRKRFCRICGQPEKKYILGYSNLTPYSEICVECLNRHVMKAPRAKEAK